MGLASLQVCMDSSDWLQGTMHEESSGIDSCSSPSAGDILTCSRPMVERRLRPPHEQGLINCPRCDSTHTKFCYYNNYSLSQPRYFCKTCRRYWTKGGTLRNIPVGGGCRKNNKKLSSKRKPNAAGASTDLHLHLLNNNNVGNTINSFDFMGNNVGDDHNHFHGIWSPFGFMGLQDHGTNSIGTGFVDSYQQSVTDVKPKLLSLEWQDQQQLQAPGCSDHIGNDSFGYLSGMGSWAGMINTYASSPPNPLL